MNTNISKLDRINDISGYGIFNELEWHSLFNYNSFIELLTLIFNINSELKELNSAQYTYYCLILIKTAFLIGKFFPKDETDVKFTNFNFEVTNPGIFAVDTINHVYSLFETVGRVLNVEEVVESIQKDND